MKLPVMYRHTQLGWATTERGALQVARVLPASRLERRTVRLADRIDPDNGQYLGQAWFAGVVLDR